MVASMISYPFSEGQMLALTESIIIESISINLQKRTLFLHTNHRKYKHQSRDLGSLVKLVNKLLTKIYKRGDLTANEAAEILD